MLPAEMAGTFILQLTNSLGEIVLHQEFAKIDKTVSLNLQGLPAGLYAVEMRSQLGRWATRVMVNKS